MGKFDKNEKVDSLHQDPEVKTRPPEDQVKESETHADKNSDPVSEGNQPKAGEHVVMGDPGKELPSAQDVGAQHRPETPALQMDKGKSRLEVNTKAVKQLEEVAKFVGKKEDTELSNEHDIPRVHGEMIKELMDRHSKGKLDSLSDGQRELINNLHERLVKGGKIKDKKAKAQP